MDQLDLVLLRGEAPRYSNSGLTRVERWTAFLLVRSRKSASRSFGSGAESKHACLVAGIRLGYCASRRMSLASKIGLGAPCFATASMARPICSVVRMDSGKARRKMGAIGFISV